MATVQSSATILSIDIGGSHIKAAILNSAGMLLQEYVKAPTPQPALPETVLDTVTALVAAFPAFDCASVGFPGYVRDGIVWTAPNLGTGYWTGADFRKMLEDRLKKPVQLINDADMHGLGVVEGKGLELVVTLGTGFGTALLLDGKLLPHLELAHHPVAGDKDYDQYIGEKEMKRIGLRRWNKRMKKVLVILKTVFNYDRLYIGGGNVAKLDIAPDPDIKIVSNKEGIRGGARLWTLLS